MKNMYIDDEIDRYIHELDILVHMINLCEHDVVNTNKSDASDIFKKFLSDFGDTLRANMQNYVTKLLDEKK